jgi:hypothetical protein
LVVVGSVVVMVLVVFPGKSFASLGSVPKKNSMLSRGMELQEKEYIDKLVLQQKEQLVIVRREGYSSYRKSKPENVEIDPYFLYSEIKLSYVVTKKGESNL